MKTVVAVVLLINAALGDAAGGSEPDCADLSFGDWKLKTGQVSGVIEIKAGSGVVRSFELINELAGHKVQSDEAIKFEQDGSCVSTGQNAKFLLKLEQSQTRTVTYGYSSNEITYASNEIGAGNVQTETAAAYRSISTVFDSSKSASDEAPVVIVSKKASDGYHKTYLEVRADKFPAPSAEEAFDFTYTLFLFDDPGNFDALRQYNEKDSRLRITVSVTNTTTMQWLQPEGEVYKKAAYDFLVTDKSLFSVPSPSIFDKLTTERTLCEMFYDEDICITIIWSSVDLIYSAYKTVDTAEIQQVASDIKMTAIYQSIPNTLLYLQKASGLWRFQFFATLPDGTDGIQVFYVNFVDLCTMETYNDVQYESVRKKNVGFDVYDNVLKEQFNLRTKITRNYVSACPEYDFEFSHQMLNGEVDSTANIRLDATQSVMTNDQQLLNHSTPGIYVVNVSMRLQGTLACETFWSKNFTVTVKNGCLFDFAESAPKVNTAINRLFSTYAAGIVKGTPEINIGSFTDLLETTTLVRQDTDFCNLAIPESQAFFHDIQLNSVMSNDPQPEAVDMMAFGGFLKDRYQLSEGKDDFIPSGAGSPFWVETENPPLTATISTTSATPEGVYSYSLRAYPYQGSQTTSITPPLHYEFVINVKIIATAPVADEEDEENEADEEAVEDITSMFTVMANQIEPYLQINFSESFAITLPEQVALFGKSGDYKQFAIKISDVSPNQFKNSVTLNLSAALIELAPMESLLAEGWEEDPTNAGVQISLLLTEGKQTSEPLLVTVAPFFEFVQDEFLDPEVLQDEIIDGEEEIIEGEEFEDFSDPEGDEDYTEFIDEDESEEFASESDEDEDFESIEDDLDSLVDEFEDDDADIEEITKNIGSLQQNSRTSRCARSRGTAAKDRGVNSEDRGLSEFKPRSLPVQTAVGCPQSRGLLQESRSILSRDLVAQELRGSYFLLLFTKKLKNLSDFKKQELLDDILKVRKTKLSQAAETLTTKKKKKPAKPELEFDTMKPDGSFSMHFDKGIAGLDILKEIGVEIKSKGKVSELFADDETPLQAEQEQALTEKSVRRLSEQAQSQSGFDLSKYISFELRRGDEDSAPIEKLGFSAKVSELENDQMKFSLEFENPLMVSVGSKKDQIVGTVQDESFFTSQDSDLSIPKGREIKTFLPKLLPGASIVEILDQAKIAVENTAQTLMTGQIIVTLALSASLKSMWNLLNVMQVLAYTRHFTVWPAMVELVVKNIIEAIYMQQINNAIMDYGKSKFEVAKSETKNEYMRQQGIEDNSLMKSLGIFAIGVACIILLVLLFFCIKMCAARLACCKKAKEMLSKKIFYNGPIRYIIVSYLKLLNQFATLLLLAFANQEGAIQIVVYSLEILVLVVWPLWTIYFLVKNRKKLGTVVYKKKFASLYQGFKIDSFKSLCYNGVFAVRRFDLVLLNIYFTIDSPLSGFDRTMYLQKILGFLFIQTFYLAYIHTTHPHTEPLFNKVEFINEYSMVALGYVMLNYIQLNPLSPDTAFDGALEIAGIAIIAFMVVFNFGVMIRMSVLKIINSYKRKRALKRAREEAEKRALERKRERKPASQPKQSSAPERRPKNRFNRDKLSKQEAKEKRKTTLLRPDTTVIQQLVIVNNQNYAMNTTNVMNVGRGEDSWRRDQPQRHYGTDNQQVTQEIIPRGMTYAEKQCLMASAAQIRLELNNMKK